ncbi:MAG: fibrinogen-like YCDxxxxGGGW domain-containing protein [Rothia sp. (in: high G+C Gram-positive bacteria)]|nr:fibrinogen-like YCDxxxxGGGW domain-containing protein [Rothia sp. (in: high G+C Gram-positive bacteria)]
MKKPSLFSKITVGAITLGIGVSSLPGAFAADEYVPNGLTSETAASSCWEVKQNDPEAESGAYWLYTPSMDAPAQFYCDQETDGGGWVMIGRGREGWTEEYYGRGKASELYTNPDGTSAFTPVQLPSTTVDELLDGDRVDSLEDGVRFHRAANTSGTMWQDVYAKRANTESWSWALRAKANWSNIRFATPPQLGFSPTIASTQNNIGIADYAYNNLTFTSSRNYGWNNGFAFGSYVQGSSDASSYLWSPTTNSPMGFTQVFIRPKITQNDADFQHIEDSGLAGESKRQLPNSYTAGMRWRTSEESGTGIVSELNTRVQAITQVGNTVFTGGDFKNVVSANGETVDQAFIAGYDVNSAELVRSFRPTFNGQIKALEALPNGLLAVGGEFTEVNGQPANGFVILNPETGETDTSLGWDVNNRITGGVPVVKTIQVQGNYVYIGGAFTHVKGSTSSYYAYSRNAARYSLTDNSVDISWRPATNGTVNGISASDDGVALAGYFTTVNGTESWKLAYLSPTEGVISKPWNWKLSYPKYTNRSGFQFDVQDAGDSVWAGGAEHLIAQYNKSDLSRRSSSITKSGGDFQDLFLDNNTDVLYGSCHCGDWIYEGGELYDTPWGTSSDIHRMRLVAAFDSQTGEVLPEFAPELSGAKGYGVWASFVDSKGVLWVGGDITKSRGANGTQSTVGFARFTPRDVTPAAAPRNLTVTTDGTTDELTWTSGTAGRTSYQVLRNNRVIATVTSGTTSYSVEHMEGARYFVRSVDNAGNYSETTPVATAPVAQVAQEPAPEATEEAPVQEPTAAPTEATPSESPVAEEPVTPIDEEAPADPEQPVVEENPAPADPVEPVAEEKPADQKIIASGDEWYVAFKLRRESDQTWRTTDYAYNTAQQWYSAPTSVGWGEASLLANAKFAFFAQPMSFFLRKEINLNANANQDLVLTTYADDGIAIYVNGKEVHRENLAAGATPSTPALSRVAYADAKAKPITVTIPASELNQGKNVIAAEVHSYRRGESATFDMDATLTTK